MLNALYQDHRELEKMLEDENLTWDERTDIKKRKLAVKDQINRVRQSWVEGDKNQSLDWDYQGGVEHFGNYNGA